MPVCPICQTDLSDNDRSFPLYGHAITCQDSTDSATAISYRAPSPLDGPSGIGGWMILVAIGLFVITGMFLLETISSLNYFDYIVFAIYLILFAYDVVCIVFMFKKSRLFLKLYIVLLCTNLGLNVLDILWLYVMDIDLSGLWPQLSGLLIGALIWIIYMLTSKRVKNTFV